MIFPDYDTFKRLSERYEKITVYREIFADFLNPVSLFINLANNDSMVFLESAEISRFSFIGVNVKKVILGIKDYVVVNGEIIRKNLVSYIRDTFKEKTQFISKDFGDFAGGIVGAFGYETVNFMDILKKPVRLPEEIHSVLFEIDNFFVFDNYKNRLYSAVCADRDEPYGLIQDKLDFLVNIAKESLQKEQEKIFSEQKFCVEREYSDSEFLKKISDVRELILSGEAIQVVLSREFRVNSYINPVSFYRALRKINPSPYMFFLKWKNLYLLGSSPETHLRVNSRRAKLKPIAGTCPSGKEEELLNDEKELSEHLMLLDLARNDLYQGCYVNSVNVKKAFQVERYSHVSHIVSEVEGEVREDVGAFQLFLKTFPAGTVSGAPKVRAIEIIDEFESSPRRFYSGCVGYINYNHSLDTCITIRGAFFENNEMILRAGAGIVSDSIPSRELQEINNKLKALFHSLKLLRFIEEENVFAN